ncbi:MAG: hypothetical protein HOP19_00650, partial [Acidobacteria bacterium]|nr:hypothetical protein [Acidobacteriota bacterium]
MRKIVIRLGVSAAALLLLSLSMAVAEKSASAKSVALPAAALQTTNAVYAIAVSGNDIYVGGLFEGIGGVAAKNIARYNVQSQKWFALGADLQTGGNGVNDAVHSITVLGADIYVGGRFSRVYKSLNNSIGVRCVAKWNANSQSWSALGSAADGLSNGVNGDVNAAAVAGGNVYFVGGFKNAYHTATNFVVVNNVAVWNPTAGTWSALGKGIGTFLGDVKAITVMGDNVYIGGQFPWVVRSNDYTLHVDCIARWNLTTKNWFSLGVDSGGSGSNGVGGDVYALANDGTNIYVGGLF